MRDQDAFLYETLELSVRGGIQEKQIHLAWSVLVLWTSTQPWLCPEACFPNVRILFRLCLCQSSYRFYHLMFI